ncbi:MAG TPA: DNA primase, partial [Spirochaetota bacterium]|nr:DNA primase [Spirochaetota bacterium]
MSLSKEIIKEIKDKSDIVSVIGEYVHSLKRSGKNWTGLCPFHNDKSPSFSVSDSYGIYKCFACGESGDVIKFIEKIENLSFVEAAHFLAKKAGINVDLSSNGSEVSNIKEEYVNFNLRLVKLFQHFLLEKKESQIAREYLLKRGLNEDIIETFKIGYAPKEYGRLEDILKKRGFSEKFLTDSGLFSNNDGRLKTLFFDRVIFPIFNYRNECVGFGGRALNDGIKPKYINSPETVLYKKSQSLYGINFAKEFINTEKKVFIVEGYVDVISCYKNGLKNVVAPCGTALTKEQVKLLARYCNEVVLLLDADD